MSPSHQSGRRGAGDSSPWQPFPWQPLAAAGRELRHCPAPTQHSTSALTCPVLKSPDSDAGQTQQGAGRRKGRVEDGGLPESSGGHLPKFVDIDFKPNPLGPGGGYPCDRRCLSAAAFAPGGCQPVALTLSQAGHPSNPHHRLSQCRTCTQFPRSLLGGRLLPEAFLRCHNPPGIFLPSYLLGLGGGVPPGFLPESSLRTKSGSDPPFCAAE